MHMEEYAMIGDGRTAALVGRNGSIDWLCWPNFASAACFASLIGSVSNGFWSLAPAEFVKNTARRYQPHTLILETTYDCAEGSVQVIDFMPVDASQSSVVRLVRGLRGIVAMRGELALRFDYGQAVPWVTHTRRGIRAVAGPDLVELQTSVPLTGEHLLTLSTFYVRDGETAEFVLTYGEYGDYAQQDTGKPVSTLR